jgi:hypothetical protein
LVKLRLHMPLSEGKSLALIHAMGRVLTSRVSDSHMELEAEVPEGIVKRLKLKEFEVKETSKPSPAHS